MKLSLLAGAFGCALYLSACVQPWDSISVTTRQVVLAADAFNAAEATATAYLRLPPCPTAALCRDPAVVKAIDPALRAGYAARKRLVTAARASSGGVVNLNDFAVLTSSITTLKSLFAQYGIGS